MNSVDTTNIAVSLDDLNKQEHLFHRYAILARKNVYSILAGRHASKLRGRGLDFEEVRKYVAGDDIRNIDWNVTARTQKTYTKVFNEEKERPSFTVLDQSSNMFFGSKKFTKSYIAGMLSAIAGFKVLKAGDRFGGVVFNDEKIDFIHPKRSRRNLLHFFNHVVDYSQALLNRSNDTPRKNRLNEVLFKITSSITHDHVVVVISDFLQADEETRKHLLNLTKHNDVICMVVRDSLEMELPSNKMLLTDGDLQMLWKTDKSIEEKYKKESEEKLKDLESGLLKYGIPTLTFNTEEEIGEQMKAVIQKAMRR
ncbi:MAG: DUF58 domain-containing protein [Reichenbachiella sp.]